MADVPYIESHGDSAALLRFFQERSDDIEKVVLYPPGSVLTFKGQPQSAPSSTFSLLVHFLSDDRRLIFGGDVELLLNDGIFSRMKIPIKLSS
jgi:hypothetical protein